ncbi:MAG: hypothetical protein RSE41_01690 [Clostridia bacterium]
MLNCLGVHLDKNIVKYAKISKNNNNIIEIQDHGIKYVKNSIEDTLVSIIEETNSKSLPIVINTPYMEYINFQVFRQISTNDINKIINLEFEDWCERLGKGPVNYSYVYKIFENLSGDYYKGVMAISEKSEIEKYTSLNDVKIAGIYPTDMLFPGVVPQEEKNYILVNLDKETSITTVLGGKEKDNLKTSVGINDIFLKFIDVLGTYKKAYEACKEFNVFASDGESNNKVQLEEIVEPILQDILHNISEEVNKNKQNINKIYITGLGTLFINIDTLFTEYFSIKSEILKPKFVVDGAGVRNIAELLEVLPACVIAKEYLLPTPNNNLEFIKKNTSSVSAIKKIFGISNNKKTDKNGNKNIFSKKIKLSDFKFTGINFSDKIHVYINQFLIIGFSFILSYYIFSNIYLYQMNKMKNDINKEYTKLNETVTLAKSDQSYIQTSTNEYKVINDEVEKLKTEIENSKIGKFTTYNVASFMQKLIKILPTNVTLKSINSDDNKNVTIIAECKEYQALGYFVADLRLKTDILTNVVIKKINNKDVITVEIGGVLPNE